MRRYLLSFASLLVLTSVAFAEPKLPESPDQWVNGVPISLESLRGKGVVLYFYEEGCPNCARRWPELIAASKKFEGKPVVFMAVNSGTNRSEVNSYVRENNVVWPVIVDADRSLEKECDVPTISLRNIYQLRIVTPDGNIIPGDPGNLEGAAEQALSGASWKVDPADIPAALRPTWMAVELGEYAKAAAGVKAGMGARDEATKVAAEKLKTAIDEVLNKRVENATQLASSGDKWQAYKSLETINTEFRGFDVPEEATTTYKELAQDATVKDELKAMKLLDAAKKIGARGGSAAVRRAVTQLEQLVSTMPNTEAAKEAQQLIDAVNASPQ